MTEVKRTDPNFDPCKNGPEHSFFVHNRPPPTCLETSHHHATFESFCMAQQQNHTTTNSNTTSTATATATTTPTVHNRANQEKAAFTMEKRLFHALHDNQIHSPSLKEFNESWAFMKAVRLMLDRNTDDGKKGNGLSVVIDVAGGHGALGALFLILSSAKEAIVIDPARVGNRNVERAWKQFYANKTLRYRHECLRSGLPDELQRILATTSPSRVLVVACHACQHLSEEILHIACQLGVHVAVIPCCQKDTSQGSSWKATSKNLNLRIETVMDLLLAGKMHAYPNYEVRMKCVDSKITPQNRIIICRRHVTVPPTSPGTSTALMDIEPPQIHDRQQQQRQSAMIERAHKKLEKAYQRAHNPLSVIAPRNRYPFQLDRLLQQQQLHLSPVTLYLSIGFAAGVCTVLAFRKL